MGRIGILQYEWPLQSHTMNFAKSLATRGHGVDLFICRCSKKLVDNSEIESCYDLRVIELDGIDQSKQWGIGWFRDKIRQFFRMTLGRHFFTPLLLPVIFSSYRSAAIEHYDCLIGIEKCGLIWAWLLSRLTGIPYLYFSLELYDEQHPYFHGKAGFSALRRAEIKAHKKALATIIQDKQRGKHLLRANGINNTTMIYLPVSIPGEPIIEPGNYFRNRFAIPSELKIVLYLGLIDEARGCLEIARLARSIMDKFTIIFHGYGEEKFLETMRRVGEGAITLSLDLVPEGQLIEIVSSAQVGLALYRTDCANDLLTAFSSEKVAMYCRAGIPFVAFDSDSYRKLKLQFDCCELIDRMDDLEDAVTRIFSNYETYRNNAFSAFASLYRYEDNANCAIDRLHELIK